MQSRNLSDLQRPLTRAAETTWRPFSATFPPTSGVPAAARGGWFPFYHDAHGRGGCQIAPQITGHNDAHATAGHRWGRPWPSGPVVAE